MAELGYASGEANLLASGEAINVLSAASGEARALLLAKLRKTWSFLEE